MVGADIYTAIIPLLAGISAAAMAVIVLSSGSSKSKFAFVLFSSAMAAWAILVSIFLLVSSPDVAIWVARLYYVAAAVLIYGFMLFCSATTPTDEPFLSVREHVLAVSVTAAISAIALYPSALISSTASSEIIDSVMLNKSVYLLYALYFISYLFLSIYALIANYRKSKNRQHRSKLRIILVVMGLCVPLGAFFNLVLPYFGNYHLIMIGPIFILPIVAAMFYAIIRHRLFDIRLAAVRTLVYVLTGGSLALIYFLLAYGLYGTLLQGTEKIDPINIIIALVLVFMFQPMRLLFNRLTNQIFYRNSYRPETFYANLSRTLSSTTQLRELLQRASKEIQQVLKVDNVSFFVYQDSKYITAGTNRYVKVSPNDVTFLNQVVLKQNRDRLYVADEMERNNDIRRLLAGYRIAAFVPLIHKENVIGYIFLGSKKSGAFTEQDTQALDTVTDELIIAIQNAISIEAVRELNATLQQRIDFATAELRSSNAQLRSLDSAKDEFLSMASHQLRTPLTSVKGYISMVLEGDVGKISTTQKKMLTEAFASSERMVHLINDFLNVSRIQTGKFMLEPVKVDLKFLIAQEAAGLEPIAKSRQLKIKTELPEEKVMVSIDEGKIRQVIMNFMDNAIYYSKPSSTITVKLMKTMTTVQVEVHDTGIGVPLEQQKKLFTKFFRADNARLQRPDGTGVGLFLAKKVIDGHKGKIIFSSNEGSGSIFGFSLPAHDTDESNHE